MNLSFQSVVSYRWIEHMLAAGQKLPKVDELREFFKDMQAEAKPEKVWATSLLGRGCIYFPKQDVFEFPTKSDETASLYTE